MVLGLRDDQRFSLRISTRPAMIVRLDVARSRAAATVVQAVAHVGHTARCESLDVLAADAREEARAAPNIIGEMVSANSSRAWRVGPAGLSGPERKAAPGAWLSPPANSSLHHRDVRKRSEGTP